MENKLKIYKSSAGSGKTFTLVKEYLRIVLSRPDEYRHILAITFTNKAAEEMKSRVIEALVSLESGADSDLRKKLEEEIPGKPITENAGRVLRSILHDYPNFAISTIDSFFQKLLRSLAREFHLPLRVELKLEEEDAVLDVTDRILRKSDEDPELSDWLQQLLLRKLDDDKGWDIQPDIRLIAEQMLRERDATAEVLSRDEIRLLFSEMLASKRDFEKVAREKAKELLDILQGHGIDPDRLSYGKSGVYGFIVKVKEGGSPDKYEIGARALRAAESAEGWLRKEDTKDRALVSLVETEFLPRLRVIIDSIRSGFRTYISNTQVLKTLFLYGIVNDLTRLFAEYRKEHNQILISDTAKMLQEIITGDDTPFIYEKTGNRYKYLLIDEFQDTSEVQWLNLLPLVQNSLSSGFMALVVGDAKQSIYRWRGGDLRLLLEGVQKHLAPFKDLIHPAHLDTNFRSKHEIVEFNNQVFSNIIPVIRSMEGLDELKILELAYGEAVSQKTAQRNNSGGYVEVRLLDTESNDKDGTKWKSKSMEQTLTTVNGLLEKGYRYRDICLLVRSKKEGNEMARFLFDNGITKVISPDSLLISGSTKIRFLINLFRILVDRENAVARSQALHYHVLHRGGDTVELHGIFRQPDRWKKEPNGGSDPMITFRELMPKEFSENMDTLSKLPVYEVSEQLVRIFGLGGKPDAFIQRFQDLVLEFNSRQHASLRSFLTWWDGNDKARDKSVVIPENENAIRIMTIHKSKGLQFPVVIMPFVAWEVLPRGGDIVWLSSDEMPFDKLGRIGIPAAGFLADSAFEKKWRKEQSDSVIDNLNLLYVALTRPEEELYVFCPRPSSDAMKKDENKTVNVLLLKTLKSLGVSPSTEGIIRRGEPPTEFRPKKDQIISQPLTSYPVNRWQDKIRVSSRTRKLADLLKERTSEKTRYGVLVHELLSSIGTVEDVETVLDRISFDGILPDDEKDKLRELVKEVMNHPDIRPFFETDWEVRRESEILTPDAETFRPDRTLTKGKDAIIVDFKTGKQDPSHHEQLANYGSLLRKMGYQHVSKYLVYLAEEPVVEQVSA